MKFFSLRAVGAVLGLAGVCALATHPLPPAHLMESVPVLPLALDDTIQFRKITSFTADTNIWKSTQDDMISFERERIFYGAVTNVDRQNRFGMYYRIYWRASRPAAHLIVRFEYKQEKLANYVQAQERSYRDVTKGTLESRFSVVGDDYNQEGKVTSWRATIIEDGKIVALNQSYLWR
jgi:hypothetical protein